MGHHKHISRDAETVTVQKKGAPKNMNRHHNRHRSKIGTYHRNDNKCNFKKDIEPKVSIGKSSLVISGSSLRPLIHFTSVYIDISRPGREFLLKVRSTNAILLEKSQNG